jgi:hypothetical protein
MHGHMNVKIVFGVNTKMCRYIPPQVETVQEKQAYDDNNYVNTGCIKMIGAVLKLIIFTSMVNRIINTSRNERVTK